MSEANFAPTVRNANFLPASDGGQASQFANPGIRIKEMS